MAAFETAEYRDRVARVNTNMAQAGIDTLVVLSEAHMSYLTGYEGSSDYVPQVTIVHAGDLDARVILREMDLYCAYPTVYLDESRIECYPENHIGTPDRSPWDVIGRRIAEIAGRGRIGVEFAASNFSFADHQALVRVLGDRELVDGSRVVTRARTKKSSAELGYMRQSARIVDRALTNGIEAIAEGVRQCDVAARITHDLIAGTPECGGGPVKPVTMPTGPGVAQAPHLKWTDAPYRKGDQTDFEVGAFVHRYCCALSRTAFLGDPPSRLLEVHEAVMDGFHGALEAIRPGATCGDVHRGFSAAFKPHGVRKESRIGYSIGLDWSDLCFSLQDDDETVLETDNTLHLIIGIWEREDAYVFSETIRVGEAGAESLSAMPRKLFVR
jgi:ectoine hydrolase